MSFFDAPPPPPPQRPPAPRPDWMGAPDGWLGGVVPNRIVLARGPELLITLGPMTAYPTGVDLVVTHSARRPILGPMGGIGGPGDIGARFGVAYADGSKWQSGGVHPFHNPLGDPPKGPLLLPGGGGGGGGRYRQDMWLWPLPPPGPVTFAFAWREEGIVETTAVVDGQLFIDAAAHAEQLWEPLSPEEQQAAIETHMAQMRRGGAVGWAVMQSAEPEPEDQ